MAVDSDFFIFSGENLASSAVLLVRAEIAELPAYVVPALLLTNFSLPPKLVSISMTGTTPEDVDYSSTSESNGLTKAFCIGTDDVVMGFQPPLDENGTSVGVNILPIVDVVFDYYMTSSEGDTEIAVDINDFAQGYGEALEDASLEDITRNWDPSIRTLRFTLGTTAGSETTHVLTVFSQLFLSEAVPGSVYA